MKSISLLALLGILCLPSARAQSIQGTNVVATNSGQSTPVVISRDANTRTWARVIPVATNAQAQITYRTNRAFVELTPGMFRQASNGEWTETSDAITVTDAGGACTNNNFQAFFAANLNTAGSIRLVSPAPEQKEIRTHIVGLSYFDSSIGSNVLIAIPQDRIGSLVSSNTVIFTNAFSAAFRADVRYTVSRASFEQDIVLVENPPSPAAWGLNPATTRLQCWSEVMTSGSPNVFESPESGQDLDFGIMQMVGPGKAFFVGSETNATPVRKTWVNSGERSLLLEEIAYSAVASRLQSLPPPSGGGGGTNGAGGLGGQAGLYPGFPKQLPPPPKLAQAGTGGLRIASATEPQPKPVGLVLDYVIVTSLSGATFQENASYLVSNSVTLSGVTTIEGGAIFKFSNSPNAKITLSGPLVSRVGPYRPIILTSWCDDSVGEIISGSSGNPTNTGATYLSGGGGQVNDYKYLRASYAGTALTNSGTANVWHSQFVNCGTAVGAGSSAINLRNVLIANTTNCLYSTGAVVAEHLTADNCTRLCGTNPSSAYATNCLLTAFVNTPSWTGSASSAYLASNTGVYTNVGGGRFYLAGGAFRDQGNTSLNATLRTDLKQKTTWPPLLLTNHFTTSTTLIPYVSRNTFTPDLGWHYDPLDYLVSNLDVGDNENPVTLLLTNGVAIGTSGDSAFNLRLGAAFISEGAPLSFNRLVWTAAAQEAGATSANLFKLTNDWVYDVILPTVQLRFTDAGSLGAPMEFFADAGLDYAYSYPYLTWTLRDSTFQGVRVFSFPLVVGSGAGGTTVNICWTNNVFERGWISMARSHYYNSGSLVAVSLHNNLFWGTDIQLTYDDSVGETFPMWELSDNIIDNGPVYYQGYTSDEGWGWTQILNNGYVNTSSLSESGAVTVSSFNYAEGPLGRWYHSSTDFHNAGSRNADAAGLCQFTTTTDQVTDSSNVDLGYHYVALNGSGQPVDSSGGGVPDWLADVNGNGTFDNGIDFGNWTVGSTVTDTNSVAALKVYTPLK